METSKKYIKMCREADIVQSKWGMNNGDFFFSDHLGVSMVVNNTTIHDIKDGFWLPRQDQCQLLTLLQDRAEGIEKIPAQSLVIAFAKFSSTIDRSEQHDPTQFETLEELWLYFFMRRNGFVWNNAVEKWCKLMIA